MSRIKAWADEETPAGLTKGLLRLSTSPLMRFLFSSSSLSLLDISYKPFSHLHIVHCDSHADKLGRVFYVEKGFDFMNHFQVEEDPDAGALVVTNEVFRLKISTVYYRSWDRFHPRTFPSTH